MEASHEYPTISSAPQHLARLVLEIDDLSDPVAAILTANYALTGRRLSTTEYAAEYARLQIDFERDLSQMPIEDRERYVVAETLNRMFIRREDQWPANLMRNWPTHKYLYETYVMSESDQTPTLPNNVLLIGAYHTLSAKAFHDMARELFRVNPAEGDRDFIVDVAGGEDKRRHSNFVYANGIKLPFQDRFMRIVQTNQLFYWLGPDEVKTDTATQKILARRVINEAYRVLQPGGYLLSCENVFKFEIEDKDDPLHAERTAEFSSWLRASLEASGFSDIVIEPAHTIKGVEYLFDTTQSFNHYERIKTPWCVGVCARKAEAV